MPGGAEFGRRLTGDAVKQPREIRYAFQPDFLRDLRHGAVGGAQQEFGVIHPERGAVLERGLAGEVLEMLDKPVPAQPARLRARFDGHRAAQLRFHLRSDFQNLRIDGALQLLHFGAAARDLRQQPGQFGGRSGQVVRLLTLHLFSFGLLIFSGRLF